MKDSTAAHVENPVLRQRHVAVASAENGFKEGSIEEVDSGLDSYVEDDSFLARIDGALRVVLCYVALAIFTTLWSIVLLLLLPFPNAALYQGNLYGHVVGRILMWICGNPLTIRGQEYAKTKAIYLSNHLSAMDVFLMIWLTPMRCVGIGKKEVVWFPFFGILFVLAGHLRIDRSNREAALSSMNKAAREIVEKNLSLIIFPEGTRSANGRLLPFKKGFVHLAIQTKRPLVPVILTGTHLAWRKNSFHVRPAPVTVTFLPPIKTDDWTVDKVNDYVEMIHDIYVKHLPECHKPLQMSPIST